MGRLSITMPEDVHNWVTEQAEKRGLTMNAIVLLALEQYRETSLTASQLEELKDYLQGKNLND